MTNTSTTAGTLLVRTLQAAGVERVYCVPGESYLAALDAFYDQDAIQVISCRHEGGAGLMAVAEAKLTGAPGVVFASRGPGSMNAALALHVAAEDACPVILFIGDPERNDAGRGAFQAVDYAKTFSDLAKEVLHVHDGAHMSRMTARAWQLATAGTPGPVVVVLPEDMLSDEVQAEVVTPASACRANVSAGQLQHVVGLIENSKRPLLIAGGQLADAAARDALRAAADAWDLPVLGGFKQQDVLDNTHRCWAGQVGFSMNSQLAESLADADLVLAVGTRLGDITSQGYSFPRAPDPAQPLIHVYPDPEQIGRNILTEHGVVADSGLFLEALSASAPSAACADRRAWVERVTAVNRRLMQLAAKPSDHGVDFGRVVSAVSQYTADDCVVAIDSGNFATWVHRYFVVRSPGRLLGSSSGAMGGGVPGGVAAALTHPDRTVVVFVGDGGALMTGNELATAQMYGARVKVIVADNSRYGTIRGYQDRLYPGRSIATDLVNPDFSAWAATFGLRGFSVTADVEVDSVIAEALQCPESAVVHVHQDPTRLTAFS